jgi:tetratricopeptide (TPR) repeat protein
MSSSSNHKTAWQHLAIWLGLVLSVFAVYAQVGQFDFVNFDDGPYAYENTAVRDGLTVPGIKAAITGVVSSNWHPATMLSLMLDSQLFGPDSGVHHLVNVVIHAMSSVLLFVLLRRATQRRWASAFVAFIFALHPLHVESVAWIAERKDVLSTFFLFLALYAYVRYAEHPNLRAYLLMLGAFALGLMSKPMLVTFPFLLLLFDFWPLRRAAGLRILWEKIPVFALSAIMSVAAYLVQQTTGSIAEAIPLAGRVAKALVSYVTYIRQTFWPTGLAVFYPYPRAILASQAGLAFLLLLAVSVLAMAAWRTRPYLATGWFWYLGTLVPVIGLVKIGEQSHADRYTYIPMIGLLLMVAWGAADAAAAWPRTRPWIHAAAILSVVTCLGLTYRQVRYWQNSETLYVHAIEVTGDNWLAEANLGAWLMKTPERRPEAIEHIEAALRLKPDDAEADNNLGLCMAQLELCGAAIPYFETALRNRPALLAARNNLAFCLARLGNYGAAITELQTTLRADPSYTDAHFNLANTLAKVPGREAEAVDQYETGLRLSFDPMSPDCASAHRKLAELLLKLGRTQDAISHFEAALSIQPDEQVSRTLSLLRAGRRVQSVAQ